MVKSLNTRLDLSIKATNLQGLTSQGNVLVGDRAFEYYNERNVADFVQIPYKEIKLVTASVIFGNKINRFAIHTKNAGDFVFSTRDNKKTLRAINKYIPSDKLRKSKSVADYVKGFFKKNK